MARTRLIEVYKDSEHKCDRCGRKHNKVYMVSNNNKIWRVGATCCKRLFGWTSTKNEINAGIDRHEARMILEAIVAQGEPVTKVQPLALSSCTGKISHSMMRSCRINRMIFEVAKEYDNVKVDGDLYGNDEITVRIN